MEALRQDEVAIHKAGSTDPDDLDELIRSAWLSAVDDPADRAQLAGLLGLTADQLKTAPAPFRAELRKSGLTGAEIVILFAAAFVNAYGEKLGKAAGTAAADFTIEKARAIWPIVKRWMFRSDTEVLGHEIDKSDT